MLPLFHYNKTKIELFSKTGGKEENPYLPPEKIDTKTGGKGLYIGSYRHQHR
ncbi:MAG TPA: hypothetical protein GXZ35_03175 [Acholeplasmataceae bacterium]|nr:hypothetical protein [Acholeplasmataceae bacterium]